MLGQAQSVTHEWVVTSRFHSTFPNASTPSRASPPFGPRHQFRGITTPPSYSPSPTPSVASPLYSADMVEIEELADDYSDDSGIELLQGEFEEAPENYGQKQEDEMDSEEEDEQEVLQRLRRLIASQHVECNAPSQASESAAGRGSFMTSALRKKRSFTESLDGSADDDESDNRTDSSSGGRIRRRKLVPMRPQQKRDTQDSSGRSTPDFMMEMDL